MTTEAPESPVLDAVVTPAVDTSLIQFDVTADAIRTMQAEAAGLSIAGPDDRTGFDAVFRFRQVVKKSRVSVEKRGKELKAPHIAYNRDVDAAVKSLVEPMETIEDGLLKQEKHYEAERERIAEEAEAARRKRYTDRQNQLVEYGFKYEHNADAYVLNEVFVLVDDIRNLPDDQYAPTEELARTTYVAEFERLAEIKRQEQEQARQAEAERKRVADEAAELQRQLLEQQAELKRQQEEIATAQKKLDDEKAKATAEEKARLKRIEDEQDAERLRQFEAAQRDFQLQQEAQQAAERATEEKARIKADRERTKRLAPDKKALNNFFFRVKVDGPVIGLKEPEADDILGAFFTDFGKLAADYLQKAEAL